MILQNKYSKLTVLHPIYANQDVEMCYHMDDKWRSIWICEMIIYVLQMNNEIVLLHPHAYDLFLMSWNYTFQLFFLIFSPNILFLPFLCI